MSSLCHTKACLRQSGWQQAASEPSCSATDTSLRTAWATCSRTCALPWASSGGRTVAPWRRWASRREAIWSLRWRSRATARRYARGRWMPRSSSTRASTAPIGRTLRVAASSTSKSASRWRSPCWLGARRFSADLALQPHQRSWWRRQRMRPRPRRSTPIRTREPFARRACPAPTCGATLGRTALAWREAGRRSASLGCGGGASALEALPLPRQPRRLLRTRWPKPEAEHSCVHSRTACRDCRCMPGLQVLGIMWVAALVMCCMV
mmetsp:Transcript_81077/g.224345  ORF Transcript_81077/g.224345 Transcript_81077/m.224345 type:complete len:265 (+) Transcript_81077:582-1376(+)